MSDSNLRDALLRQDPVTPVEAELEVLDGLVRAEERRARRLTRWTIVVWGVWLAIVVGGFAVYAALERAAPAPDEAGASVGLTTRRDVESIDSARGSPLRVPLRIAGALVAAALLLLPAVGIVLLILMVLSRRSASTSRIRGSLASIDAQLRLLAINRGGPPGEPRPLRET